MAKHRVKNSHHPADKYPRVRTLDPPLMRQLGWMWLWIPPSSRKVILPETFFNASHEQQFIIRQICNVEHKNKEKIAVFNRRHSDEVIPLLIIKIDLVWHWARSHRYCHVGWGCTMNTHKYEHVCMHTYTVLRRKAALRTWPKPMKTNGPRSIKKYDSSLWMGNSRSMTIKRTHGPSGGSVSIYRSSVAYSGCCAALIVILSSPTFSTFMAAPCASGETTLRERRRAWEGGHRWRRNSWPGRRRREEMVHGEEWGEHLGDTWVAKLGPISSDSTPGLAVWEKLWASRCIIDPFLMMFSRITSVLALLHNIQYVLQITYLVETGRMDGYHNDCLLSFY